jgi:hypothetical protein
MWAFYGGLEDNECDSVNSPTVNLRQEGLLSFYHRDKQWDLMKTESRETEGYCKSLQ